MKGYNNPPMAGIGTPHIGGRANKLLPDLKEREARFDRIGIEDITAINEQWCLHRTAKDFPRWHAEGLPLRDVEDSIHIEGGVINITRIADAVAKMTTCLWHSDGVVDSYLTAGIEE